MRAHLSSITPFSAPPTESEYTNVTNFRRSSGSLDAGIGGFMSTAKVISSSCCLSSSSSLLSYISMEQSSRSPKPRHVGPHPFHEPTPSTAHSLLPRLVKRLASHAGRPASVCAPPRTHPLSSSAAADTAAPRASRTRRACAAVDYACVAAADPQLLAPAPRTSARAPSTLHSPVEHGTVLTSALQSCAVSQHTAVRSHEPVSFSIFHRHG